MKKTFCKVVEHGRIIDGRWGTDRGEPAGAFKIKYHGAWFQVIAASGDDGIPWEHVSISLPNRCASWDEMCYFKSLFWEDDEVVVQFHVDGARKVDIHPYCLHLWKPHGQPIELPPSMAV